MNSTMNSNDLAQSSKTTFNISDYVNFDFDFEAPLQSVGVSSETSVVKPLQGMSIDDPFFGFVDAIDAELTGVFQLPDDSNALGDGYDTSPRSSEDVGNPNTLEAPVTTAVGLGTFNAVNLASEDLGMTDSSQKTIETHSPLEDFNVSEPTSLFDGVDPAALVIPRSPSRSVPLPTQLSANSQYPASPQIMRDAVSGTLGTQREPSRWRPACPQLQQHLNSVYATELASLRSNPNRAPVLYFPAGHHLGSPVPVRSFSPRSVPTQYRFPQTSRPRTENPSYNPSSLMQKTGGSSLQQPSLNRIHHTTSPTTDDEAPITEDVTMTPIKKRALDANESDSEPASKQTKTSQAEELSVIMKDEYSDDDDEPITTRARTARKNLLPAVTKDDGSEDESINETYDRDSSDLSSALPPPISRPPRTQRGTQGSRPHTSGLNAKGKSPNRKMQKLLEEIQDTEEYSEAQGYEAENERSQGSVPRRPVRKGARKSYVGQE